MENQSNHTFDFFKACDPNDRPSAQNIVGAIVILLVSSIAITENGLVLISFFNCNLLRKQKGSCLIANLALSDFLCSVYVMLPSVVFLFNRNWSISGYTCIVHGTMNSILFTSSNMSLAAISVDRAIAINRPFNYPNLVTTFRIKMAVAYIWIHSFCQMPAVFGWVKFSSWELMCTPIWSNQNKAYYWVASTLCITLPSALLLGSNVAIISAIRRSRSVVFQNCPEPFGNGNQLCVKTNTKTLRSMYILVFVYFSCVSPYYVAKIGMAIKNANVIPDGFCLLPTTLLYSAAAINPLIYTLLRKDHKRAVLKTLRRIYRKLKELQVFLCGHPDQEGRN